MWQVTCDMWHVKCDMWRIEGFDDSVKISGPYPKRFWSEGWVKIWRKRSVNQSVNELNMNMFVEQHKLHRVCY